MTNEEAIRYFKRHIDLYCVDGISREAEEMAIKALEQQPITTTNNDEPITVIYPTTVCDDAISREAVDELSKELVHTTKDKADFLCNFWEGLRKLPPVTPQQKYGKWIDYSDEGFVECPFCGHATNCEDNIDELHYCFYCGCRMVELQEERSRQNETDD